MFFFILLFLSAFLSVYWMTPDSPQNEVREISSQNRAPSGILRLSERDWEPVREFEDSQNLDFKNHMEAFEKYRTIYSSILGQEKIPASFTIGVDKAERDFLSRMKFPDETRRRLELIFEQFREVVVGVFQERAESIDLLLNSSEGRAALASSAAAEFGTEAIDRFLEEQKDPVLINTCALYQEACEEFYQSSYSQKGFAFDHVSNPFESAYFVSKIRSALGREQKPLDDYLSILDLTQRENEAVRQLHQIEEEYDLTYDERRELFERLVRDPEAQFSIDGLSKKIPLPKDR